MGFGVLLEGPQSSKARPGQKHQVMESKLPEHPLALVPNKIPTKPSGCRKGWCKTCHFRGGGGGVRDSVLGWLKDKPKRNSRIRQTRFPLRRESTDTGRWPTQPPSAKLSPRLSKSCYWAQGCHAHSNTCCVEIWKARCLNMLAHVTLNMTHPLFQACSC